MMTRTPTNLTTWQVLRLLWHLPNFFKLYWRLFTDRRVPLRAKAILVAAVLYVLDPIDLLPDFLFPFFGMLDDLAVCIFAARWFISLCPPDVVQEQVREISEE
ncbi:MAG: DUF1232 domain-containing protein [Deltaproteobacteria bacterium]|nr:DUF1232 domain-containing protein [Deltaproteobacteria bacterium]